MRRIRIFIDKFRIDPDIARVFCKSAVFNERIHSCAGICRRRIDAGERIADIYGDLCFFSYFPNAGMILLLTLQRSDLCTPVSKKRISAKLCRGLFRNRSGAQGHIMVPGEAVRRKDRVPHRRVDSIVRSQRS